MDQASSRGPWWPLIAAIPIAFAGLAVISAARGQQHRASAADRPASPPPSSAVVAASPPPSLTIPTRYVPVPGGCVNTAFRVTVTSLTAGGGGARATVQLSYIGSSVCSIGLYGPQLTLVDRHGTARAQGANTTFVAYDPDVVPVRPGDSVALGFSWRQWCSERDIAPARVLVDLSNGPRPSGPPLVVELPTSRVACTTDTTFPAVAILNVDGLLITEHDRSAQPLGP